MPQPSKIGTSTTHWFVRGLASGLLLVSAANAGSYFFRSGGAGRLFGEGAAQEQAIGFPFEIWREGRFYSGSPINLTMLQWNLLVGVLLGVVLGFVFIAWKVRLNQWIAEFENRESQHQQIKFQFSLKSILALTTIAALIFAATTAWGSSPQLLGAIYFLGPLVLILIAMQPDSIRWFYRVVILILVAKGMIAIAIMTGQQLGLTMDQVLLGIFVSWTPQSAFAALFIVAGMLWQGWRDREPTLSDEPTV